MIQPTMGWNIGIRWSSTGCCSLPRLGRPRAVEFIDRCIAEKRLELDADRLEKLRRACRLHTTERQTGDITVDTCFDADRLDLGRVGIYPMEEKMATDAGKKVARKLAQAGVPVFHQREWIRDFRF